MCGIKFIFRISHGGHIEIQHGGRMNNFFCLTHILKDSEHFFVFNVQNSMIFSRNAWPGLFSAPICPTDHVRGNNAHPQKPGPNNGNLQTWPQLHPLKNKSPGGFRIFRNNLLKTNERGPFNSKRRYAICTTRTSHEMSVKSFTS